MMKKLLWFVVGLLLLSSVTAFEVEVSPEEQTIVIGEKAEFDIAVSHDSSVTEYFEIYSSDVQWDLSTVPSTDRILEVPAGKTKATKLLLRPLFPEAGLYLVDITFKRSGTNELIRKNLQIGIARATDEYSPAIFTKVDIPKKVDPREEIPIKITLKNQNRRYIQNLDVKIRSVLINKDYGTSLKPLETKELEFKVRLDEATPPQQDVLKVSLFAFARNRTVRFDVPGAPYEVISFGDVEEKIDVAKGFLSTTRTVTLRNTGNGIQKKSFQIPASFFAQLFTSSDRPFYSVKTSEGRVLVWEVEIGSAATETIIITRNFMPLFLVIVLLIIGLAAYFVFRSPLILKKASMVMETKEGGISELKVIISMANRTNYPVRNLIIYDKVPKIAEVHSDFEVGTLRPSKIINAGDKGTLLKWNIDSLGPREERILSYKIKTKLSILGGFRLPPAKIKFKFFNYERTNYSNVESLFSSR